MKTTWKINQLMSSEAPIILMSNFTITGEEDGLKGSVTYSVNLLPVEEGDTLLPLDQITEDVVIGWTKDALGEDRVAAMTKEVQDQIDAQKVKQPSPVELPWAVKEEAPAVEEAAVA